MKSNRLILVLLCSVIIMFSCGKKQNSTGAKAGDSVSSSQVVQNVEPGKKFKIESGKIVINSEMMGMKMKQTFYFEDYGKKYLMETDMGFGKSIEFDKDGKHIRINETAKTINDKGSALDLANQFMGFDFYSDYEKSKAKWSVLGTEEIAGKPCDKYSVDVPDYKTKGYYWIWKDTNIILKMDVDQNGNKITWTAESAEPGVKIPAELMNIPAGYKEE